MRNTLTSSLFLVLLAVSGVVIANSEATKGNMHIASTAGDHGMSGAKDLETSTAQPHRAHGQVNKVDFQNGKVNLTHGPIKTLGWPGMTMDFKVKDMSILKRIMPGQEVDFEVVNEGPGQYYVVKITPSK
jgi:Cu(I)/Ag(I) efflux system protein CusF